MISPQNLFTLSSRPKYLQNQKTASNNDDAITRSELEKIFAYELRTANSHMSKLKMYSKDERFTQSQSR